MNNSFPSDNPSDSGTAVEDGRTRILLSALVALVLAAAGAIGAWSLANKVPVTTLHKPDIYFSSDTSRVQSNMVSRGSSPISHGRTKVHPIFSIIFHPAYHAVALTMRADIGKDPFSPEARRVGRVMSGIAAGLATALFFVLLRLARIRMLDAVVFTVLAGCSAFSLFWFTVPETYPWGAVTILTALVVAAAGIHRTVPAGWFVLANVLSLAVTTTNWTVGILATWFSVKWRKAVVLIGIGFFITLTLAVAQKLVFPSSWLFIKPKGEQSFMMESRSGGPLRCWNSLFFHTVAMPAVTEEPHSKMKGFTVLRTQNSAAGSASLWGKVALPIWGLLLAGGVFALITVRGLGPLRLTLGIALLGQLSLHTIYGSETFLYAAHVGPMMVAMAALGTLTRFRPFVLAGAILLIICLALNNFPQFDHAMQLLDAHQ